MCRRLLAGSTLVLALAACQQAQDPSISDADRATIRAVADSALAIGNAATKDWTAYVQAYYTGDAIVLPPNAPLQQGAAALAAFFSSSPPMSGFRFELGEIEGAGDLAYVRGRYWLTVTPAGGAAVPDSGKYIEIWRRQSAGAWRVTRDIFNSDIPLPPPPAPSRR